ncbi:MAG: flagellar biosynthesis anti-sigma factor FlgM [Lautropia sp.]|nr:flagellar biosynthesis anti-sigma factor FlgM [Lautropia sp.]
MITGKTPFISTVSLLSRPVTTAAAGVVSAATGSEEDIKPIPATDKVLLSEPGLHLLPGQADEQDAIRQERVQALKQAIEEKRYHVNSRQIAEKLLQEASELMKTLTGFPLDPMEEDAGESPEASTGEPDRQARAESGAGTFANVHPKPIPPRT